MDVFFVILLSFSLADGFDYQRRCLLYKNTCVVRCPPDMHPYHTRCDRDTVAQKTCSAMYEQVIGYTCGWSRCDCNGIMVLNEDTGNCVAMEECPSDTRKRKSSRRGMSRRKSFKMPKNVRVIDEGDLIDLEK